MLEDENPCLSTHKYEAVFVNWPTSEKTSLRMRYLNWNLINERIQLGKAPKEGHNRSGSESKFSSRLIIGKCLSILPSFLISFYFITSQCHETFLGGSDGKESACNAGDSGSIPGSGISPEEGNGYPLQYSCLQNPMDWGAWWGPWGHKDSDMTEQLSTHTPWNQHSERRCVSRCQEKQRGDLSSLIWGSYLLVGS